MGRPQSPTPGSPADLSPDADPLAVARGIVLRSLTARPRTRAELEALLARRGVSHQVAEAVLDRFEQVGLVDDQAYAEMLVSSRGRQGRSRRAMAAELQRKGVDRDVVAEAAASVTPDDEMQAAIACARSRLRTTSAPPDVVRRRAMSALARRGFDADVARRALDIAWAERAGTAGHPTET